MNVDPHYQRQKCRSLTLVSAIYIISRYSKAFLTGASSNLSGVVEIDELTVSRCHIFVSVRNNVGIGINYTLRRHTDLDSCRHQQG